MATHPFSQTHVQIVMPHNAAVHAVLSAAPSSLTLETPGGAIRVEVRQGFFDRRRLLISPG